MVLKQFVDESAIAPVAVDFVAAVYALLGTQLNALTIRDVVVRLHVGLGGERVAGATLALVVDADVLGVVDDWEVGVLCSESRRHIVGLRHVTRVIRDSDDILGFEVDHDCPVWNLPLNFNLIDFGLQLLEVKSEQVLLLLPGPV